MHKWVFQRAFIWWKYHKSEGWVLFEVFEKLMSACFIQISRETILLPYILIIYMKMFETIVVLTYHMFIANRIHWQSFPGFVISHYTTLTRHGFSGGCGGVRTPQKWFAHPRGIWHRPQKFLHPLKLYIFWFDSFIFDYSYY
jgi:hypothetical protein